MTATGVCPHLQCCLCTLFWPPQHITSTSKSFAGDLQTCYILRSYDSTDDGGHGDIGRKKNPTHRSCGCVIHTSVMGPAKESNLYNTDLVSSATCSRLKLGLNSSEGN